MADPLYDLLRPHLPPATTSSPTPPLSAETSQYLSRLVSLRLDDLTTTEPQSLGQAAQSTLVSIQALSARAHRTTTTSSDHLSTLRSSLPLLSSSVDAIRQAIPDLDAGAVTFASSYGSSSNKDETSGAGNVLLHQRREAALLARRAEKAQDILELPSLLSAAIASAANATGGANHSQALDLFAHIKRLHMLYPDSHLVRSVLADAEVAMKDMTTNLVASLRAPNLRLAAAIRTVGWLRRVAPELQTTGATKPNFQSKQPRLDLSAAATTPSPDEGHFGALFLCARLCTFLVTAEALAPLRDLADQETEARMAGTGTGGKQDPSSRKARPEPMRTGSTSNNLPGQQTERYLKRYVEVFREQSFATVGMYRSIFPPAADEGDEDEPRRLETSLSLPPALQSFPLYLVELLVETLKTYLPNVADPAARESLLMQVLYAANSLGRLGADFSLMIATLDEDEDEGDAKGEADVDQTRDEAVVPVHTADDNVDDTRNGDEAATSDSEGKGQDDQPETETAAAVAMPEPEWVSVIKKHRIQAARLEALAAGQDRVVQRRESGDIAVR
jgi:hypothetical protein